MADILIIDDDQKICRVLSELVKSLGHNATVGISITEGRDLGILGNFDLILLDLELPDGNGLQILPDLLKSSSNPEVIIITGTGDARGAELAFKHGAWDYIQKPFLLDQVRLPITRALQYRQQNKTTQDPIVLNREDIIGSSSILNNSLEMMAKAAVTDSSVLITGETGTGKELFARAIHKNSSRASSGYITVDCGSLPESLAESILFGHEKGAFTGADSKREGVIQQADGGTLFLDEIGDLPLPIQKTLLRTLQERLVRPLGAKAEILVDFRLVAATHRDLNSMVKNNTFRKDLLFRIGAINIKLPPLRDRIKDIQEIAIQKISQLSQQRGIGVKGISPEVLEAFLKYDWPGNVRELINVVEYAIAASGKEETLVPKHLPPELRTLLIDFGEPKVSTALKHEGEKQDHIFDLPSWPDFRDQAEKEYLIKLLDRVQGNREEACSVSGMSQSSLYGLLKKHKLSRFKSS